MGELHDDKSDPDQTRSLAGAGPSPPSPGTGTTVTSSGAPVVPAGSSAPALPIRYSDLGRLASGGFGEVRRVLDTALDRVVAMKILHAEVAARVSAKARFVAEVKLTAGLQHPGIVAVHDWGELDDGRLWFTMREVRGRTLGAVIREVHDAADDGGFREASSGWTFRRLVDAFARVCQAVAYAHRFGVVHRDLKPDNVMVGDLGDVLVMDWGLGRRVAGADDPPEPSPDALPSGGAPQLTRHGDVLGTPAYMPPEQALGQRDLHGPPSDVYALGAILYHLLAGRSPYEGSAAGVLQQVIAGAPTPVERAALPRRVPEELAAACERAMRHAIAERYPDAEALAQDVVAWLDGARRREQALAVVERARALEPKITAQKARAARLQVEAAALLDGVQPFDLVERKRPAWALEDEAARLDVEAALHEAEWLETLHGALSQDPELPEAHAALADHYRDQLLDAERAHRDVEAARAEARLRAHDRGRHAALLRGEGALTLVTDPPGAEARISRYMLRDRRLVLEDLGVFGVTPLRAAPLPKGSYRLRVRAPGRAEVLYPVLIERGVHWDGRAPGESEPCPLVLPAEGEIGPDERYVPSGWCWVGGDAEASDSLPAKRVWVDAFMIGRFPVTNAEYIAFLNDLVTAGREKEALAACPRSQLGMGDATADRPFFGRDRGGRFLAVDDELGRPVSLDAPVVLVDWFGAVAYARWLAGWTGRPFRLPDEIEREKAARGADGRLCPWGDHLEATFSCVCESHPGEPARATVHEYPVDESPYGVRGLAGNSRDWCGNVWRLGGPPVEGGRLRVVEAAWDDPEFRAVRGGAWSSALNFSRSATRLGNRPILRRTTTGLRVARSQ